MRIVYVVDGDASVREGLARLMDSAGLQARPCASLSEFLAQADNMPAACALLDVGGARRFPAKELGTLRVVAQLLPVIALSSSDDPAARDLARELGARFFFRKPVDAAALLDAIDWVMHGDFRHKPE